MGRYRPLRADIDLDALRHNYRVAQAAAGSGRCLAVVKANAYGHGAIECAHALADMAPAFAVAMIEEAEALRDSGIAHPIVLLEGFFSATEIALIAERQYWPAVHQAWQVDALLAATPSQPINVWLKLDSGMHRLGFSPDEAVAQWQRLAACPHVTGLHLVTHFATADGADDAAQRQYQQQRACVAEVVARLHALGYDVPCCLANSPATVRGDARGEWHRPGIILYGGVPCEERMPSVSLRTVMTLSSRLIAIRTLEAGEALGYSRGFVAPTRMTVGIVACGYADGYDRHAQEGTPVLVDGQRTRLIGRVSMDMLTIDLSTVEQPSLSSEVVLWGRSATGAALPIEDVAKGCSTIAYTLMTGISARVPRYYHASAQ